MAQQRAELIRGCSCHGGPGLGEALRRDRLPSQGATASRPLGMAYIEPSTLPPQRPRRSHTLVWNFPTTGLTRVEEWRLGDLYAL